LSCYSHNGDFNQIWNSEGVAFSFIKYQKYSDRNYTNKEWTNLHTINFKIVPTEDAAKVNPGVGDNSFSVYLPQNCANVRCRRAGEDDDNPCCSKKPKPNPPGDEDDPQCPVPNGYEFIDLENLPYPPNGLPGNFSTKFVNIYFSIKPLFVL
jgi:hypothetical protein